MLDKYKMRIDFFETNNGMDTRAVGAGVYMIELENRITKIKFAYI